MRMAAWLAAIVAVAMWSAAAAQDAPFQVGLAEIDITPPVGYRMDGYFYERLNTGERDPLKAKAIVFRQGDTRGGARRLRPHWRAADADERRARAGVGANGHSGRQHRHRRHALAYGAALRRRAGAAVQRARGGEVRQGSRSRR